MEKITILIEELTKSKLTKKEVINEIENIMNDKKVEEVLNILKSEDRTQAGKTANPEGLYLRNVFY